LSDIRGFFDYLGGITKEELMEENLEFKPIEEVTPEEILAEYAEADESYAVQNDEVEG
jgi:hypothetical protein